MASQPILLSSPVPLRKGKRHLTNSQQPIQSGLSLNTHSQKATCSQSTQLLAEIGYFAQPQMQLLGSLAGGQGHAEAFPSQGLEQLQESSSTASSGTQSLHGIAALRDPAIFRYA